MGFAPPIAQIFASFTAEGIRGILLIIYPLVSLQAVYQSLPC